MINWCSGRCYAVEQGIQLREQHGDQSDDTKRFLLGMMDQLDQEKSKLSAQLNSVDKKEYILNFAVKVFKIADDEDRAGGTNKMTARNFYHASIFFDILKQFGELDDETKSLLLYAKWRATQINGAILRGEEIPLPPADDNNDSLLTNEFNALSSPEDQGSSYQPGQMDNGHSYQPEPVMDNVSSYQPGQMDNGHSYQPESISNSYQDDTYQRNQSDDRVGTTDPAQMQVDEMDIDALLKEFGVDNLPEETEQDDMDIDLKERYPEVPEYRPSVSERSSLNSSQSDSDYDLPSVPTYTPDSEEVVILPEIPSVKDSVTVYRPGITGSHPPPGSVNHNAPSQRPSQNLESSNMEVISIHSPGSSVPQYTNPNPAKKVENNQNYVRVYPEENTPRQPVIRKSVTRQPEVQHDMRKVYDSQKFAKNAISSIKFNDIPGAVENLYKVLDILTGNTQ
eukprot:TRINITY_DN371_c0_g1_i2.p1 TRINITY_DN371_c0_g1~~TRINITY_DN371_c0_g1_i2.p1  ORF type:complete len:452 (-),score=114.50 TRINITY_DN371_c0_g1_i2:12-1367(-)